MPPNHLLIDGFVLRFPRTGIVNYVFHVVEELLRRSEIDVTVLLADLNFSDAEIAAFVRQSVRTRLYEECAPSTLSEMIRERIGGRKSITRQTGITIPVATRERTFLRILI
jgi:hypothetical protein